MKNILIIIAIFFSATFLHTAYRNSTSKSDPTPITQYTQGLSTHDVVLLRSEWFKLGRPTYEIGTEDTAYYAHHYLIVNDSTIKMYGYMFLDSATYTGEWGVSKIDIINDESFKR